MQEILAFKLIPQHLKWSPIVSGAVYLISDELEFYWKAERQSIHSYGKLASALIEFGVAVLSNESELVLDDPIILRALQHFEEQLVDRPLTDGPTKEIIISTETRDDHEVAFQEDDPDSAALADSMLAALANRPLMTPIRYPFNAPGPNQKVTIISEGEQAITFTIKVRCLLINPAGRPSIPPPEAAGYENQ